MSALYIINRIASRQHGLALAYDAHALGVTREELRHLVRTGRIDRVTRRVLRVPGAPRTDLQAVLTAVLDAAPGAFACGHTAAAIWEVAGYRLAPVHVVRPRGLSGRRSSLAVLHEVKRLLPRHVTVLKDVPVVRPERMVLDLCASEHPRRAARALDDAWRRRLLSGRSLRALVSETSVQGRPGLSLLRALLDERGDDYVPPASNLEARFASIITQAGLPEMRRQVDSGDDERWVGRVDFRDVDRPLIVEIQSETFHSALIDRVEDEARLAALRAAGFEVVEITEEQVWHRPREVVRTMREARARL
ncbi:MAG TPA: type IV toxin-antitoxin system AbiEi family antitoxin domain-containing protein [Acidimicrobiales bacterium]